MNNKDELAHLEPLIGDVIFQAFFEDDDFRSVMKTLNNSLREIIPLDASNPISFALDAPNTYFVTSFHAARAVELTHQAVTSKIGNANGVVRLMSIQHAYLLEAVFNLHCAQTFFQLAPIKKAIGEKKAAAIDGAFSKNFPRLRDARNALAHQDERTLAIVDGICRIEKLDILEAIDRMQFISLAGTKLTVKDKAQDDLVFEFPSSLILKTAKDVGSTIGAA